MQNQLQCSPFVYGISLEISPKKVQVCCVNVILCKWLCQSYVACWTFILSDINKRIPDLISHDLKVIMSFPEYFKLNLHLTCSLFYVNTTFISDIGVTLLISFYLLSCEFTNFTDLCNNKNLMHLLNGHVKSRLTTIWSKTKFHGTST